MHDVRFTTTSRRLAGVLILAGAVLAGTFATAAAFNGRSDGATPPPSASPSQLPVASPTPTPVVPAPPEPTPVVPTAEPTAQPTDGGGDAMPIKVDLDTATGHDVYVDIVDSSGTLVDAVSGTPGDGMSVEPYTLHVENVDARTLRLTWVDFPIDNALALYIDEPALRFVLVQPEPENGSDAMGFDRELIITFEQPIVAADIETFLQGGLDTPGE